MARWGLRWLFCWLSVLVTACGQLTSPTPTEKSQTHVPPIERFTPPATASPTELIRPSYTLTPLGSVATTRQTPTGIPSDLQVQSLACYESAVQSLVCLGWLHNTSSSTAFTDVAIHVYLLNQSGDPISIGITTLPVPVLLPESGSPYRVVFSQIPDTWFSHAEIHHALVASQQTGSRVFTTHLILADLKVDWANSTYRVSGRVISPTLYWIDTLRVIVTIRDAGNHITGFRVLDLPPSAHEVPDGAFFSVDVAPLTGVPGQVSVMALGYRLNE